MPLFLKTIHLILDFLLILLSFTLAYFLRVGFILSTDFPFYKYFTVFLPTSIIWIGVLIFEKIYSTKPITKRRLFTNIIKSNLVGITVFVLIFFYKRDIFFSRLMLIYVWGISNMLIVGNAWLFRILKFQIYKKGLGTKKTLVVGANKTAEEAIKNLQQNEPYYEVVAILDAYGSKKEQICGIPILGKMNSLEEIITTKNIQVIMQADCIEQSINLLQIAESKKIDYFLMPSLLGSYHAHLKVIMVGKKTVICLPLSQSS